MPSASSRENRILIELINGRFCMSDTSPLASLAALPGDNLPNGCSDWGQISQILLPIDRFGSLSDLCSV
jgi:hypothetical protein